MYELAESEVNYISHGPEEEQLPGLGELKVKLEQIISYCKESQRFVLVCKAFFICYLHGWSYVTDKVWDFERGRRPSIKRHPATWFSISI